MSPAKRSFELSFDHFLDALAAVAVAKFPTLPPTAALTALYDRHIRPLYAVRFAAMAPAAASGGGGGGGGREAGSENGGAATGLLPAGEGTVVASVASGGMHRMTVVRRSNVMLTSSGVAAANSEAGAGPAVPIVVGQTTETAVVTGALSLLPGASGAASVIDCGAVSPASVRRRVTAIIGSTDGAAAPHQSAAAKPGGAAALRSPPRPAPLFGAARGAAMSMFSVNPYSAEALGTGVTRGGSSSPAAAATSPAARAAAAAAPSPTARMMAMMAE